MPVIKVSLFAGAMSNFSYNNTTMATRVSETDGLSSHVGVIILFMILAACIGAAIIFFTIYCHYKHVRSTRRLRRKPVCAATHLKTRGTRDQRQGGAKTEPLQQTKTLPLSSIAETDSCIGLGMVTLAWRGTVKPCHLSPRYTTSVAGLIRN